MSAWLLDTTAVRSRVNHRHFRDLANDARLYVRRSATLLRVANALGKGRSQLIASVPCGIRPVGVLVRVLSRDVLNVDSILAKADLFKRVFRRPLAVHVRVSRLHFDSTLDVDAPLVYAGSD